MKDIKRLAIVAVISAVGMLVIVLATRIGASYASPPPPPSGSQYPVVDAGIEPGILANQAYTVSRIQTITLEPLVRPITDRPDMRSDLMTGTYPVHVQDMYYNWPGVAGSYIRVITESDDILVSTPTTPSLPYGAADEKGYRYYPGAQPWVSVSYRRRAVTTTAPYAQQYGGMITVATDNIASSWLFYDPLTSTVVYTRQYPPNAPSDYWGISHSMPYLVSSDPYPDEEAEGRVTWFATTDNFYGKVVLSDTIFGSDLTVTRFTMSPLTPTIGQRVYATVTVQNVGPMTAWRWFRTELYLKPETAPLPISAIDIMTRWEKYLGIDPFVFHKLDPGFDWPVAQLGPSESITLVTAITVVRSSGSGRLKAYAQVDTAQEEDTVHYAWFGSNPEGYCLRAEGCAVNTRPPEEYNVVTLRDASGQHDQLVYIPEFYWLDVSSNTDYAKAPAGRKVVFWLRVANMGNVTDTYTVTVASAQPAWTVQPAFTVGPVRYEMSPLGSGGNDRTFSVTVGVPPTARENDFTWVTVTLKSRGDLTHVASDTVKLRAICGLYDFYLPIIKKFK